MLNKIGFLKIPYAIRIALKVFFVFIVLQTTGRIVFYTFSTSLQLEASLSKIFILGFRYDARMAAVLAVFILVLFLFPFLHSFNKKKWAVFYTILFTLIAAIFILVYITDFYFYDYRKDRLNADLLNYFGGADNSIGAGMVTQSYPVAWLIVLLILLTVFCSYIFYRIFYYTKKITPQPLVKWKYVLFFVFIIITLNYTIVGNIILYPGGGYPLRWSNATALGKNSSKIALNPFQSFLSSLKYNQAGYNEKLAMQGMPIMQQYFGINNVSDSTNKNINRQMLAPNGKPMNVVLVICESFSGYKSSMFGNALNASPYFNSLCNKGIFFTNCYTPAYGTARGVWATITGIPDVQVPKDATRNPFIVNQHTVLNDIKNYEKYYFIGGSTSWANIRGLLKNNIDSLKLYEQEDYSSSKLDVWGISDNDLFKEANNKLKTANKPFFAVIQTANNHRPYSIPKADADEMGLVNLKEEELISNGFLSNDELNAYRYSDFNFKKFMEAAEKESYFENTLFVFVGDHGIRSDKPKNKLFADAYYDEQLTCVHVPLLFYSKNMVPQKLDDVASQLDVLPTIASYIGQPFLNTTFGDNLFAPTIKNKFAFVIDHDAKTIGLVNNDLVYRRSLQGVEYGKVSSLKNNDPLPQSNLGYYDSLTKAYFETARYIIYNNKRQ